MLWLKYKKTFILYVLLFCSISNIHGNIESTQQAKDSIRQLIQYASKQTFVNLSEATTSVNLALKIAIEHDLKPQQFQVFRIKGYILEQNSHLLEAMDAYRNALLLQNFVNDSSKLDIFIDWAILNKKINNNKIAQEYYTYTLDIAEKQGDILMICYAYNGLATLHSASGDFEKAIDYYHKAIVVTERNGQKQDLPACYRNIALVYLNANNSYLALHNAEVSYKLALEVKDSANIAGCLETLGTIYAAKGDAKTALEKDLAALKIMEKGGDKRILVDILIQTADVYVQLNQLEKAEELYNRCIEYKSFFDYLIHPTFYYKLGNLYLKKNKFTDAFVAFKQSLALATKGGFKDLIQKNNLALASIYKQKKDFSNAYLCLETARLYGDSLFNEEKVRNITQAQFIFDAERSEKKYKDLQLHQSQIWLVSLIMFFSVITISLVYFLYLRGQNNKALKIKNDEIKQKNHSLEESNEILQQFAYASAHDLREPLRSISSFTSIIKRRYVALLPPEASDYMNFVTLGVKRMETLLSALLEYSTIIVESNIVSEPTSIYSVLEDVKTNLHTIVDEKQGSIFYTQSTCAIRMSRLHMTQLFQNLIGNALKFANKPPKIYVMCKSSKDYFLITIQDNGIGINPEYGNKIFRLFQRLNKPADYEGTGIGLTICKNIVEKYGGKIWFESELNVGTTFFISLPIDLFEPSSAVTEGGIFLKKDVVSV